MRLTSRLITLAWSAGLAVLLSLVATVAPAGATAIAPARAGTRAPARQPRPAPASGRSSASPPAT